MLSTLKAEYETIKDLGADLIGISPDSLESHSSFCESLGGCPFPLASDPRLEVARSYEALADDGSNEVRSVYVLEQDGIIIHKIPWYQPGNVGQFMEIFQALGLE